MITVTPPAIYHAMDVGEKQLRPRGASADSDRIDQFAANALRFLVSSPRNTVLKHVGMEDYTAPGLQRVSQKNVRVVKRGHLRPAPFLGEID